MRKFLYAEVTTLAEAAGTMIPSLTVGLSTRQVADWPLLYRNCFKKLDRWSTNSNFQVFVKRFSLFGVSCFKVLVKLSIASQAHTFQPGAVYDKKIYLIDDLSPEGVYLQNKLACLQKWKIMIVLSNILD